MPAHKLHAALRATTVGESAKLVAASQTPNGILAFGKVCWIDLGVARNQAQPIRSPPVSAEPTQDTTSPSVCGLIAPLRDEFRTHGARGLVDEYWETHHTP